MATTIYGSEVSFEAWPFMSSGGTVYGGETQSFAPYPRPQDLSVHYQNKVWDTIASQWIYWNTATPDYAGDEYPGPGSWGTETSGYGVEALVFGRYQRV